VWLPVAVVVAWALVRLFGWDSRYPVFPLMAYTPYVAAGSLLPLTLAAMTRRWIAAGVAALVVGAFAVAVLPRAVSDSAHHPADGLRLRVLSANLHVGRAAPSELVALVRKVRADVVVLVDLSSGEIGMLDRAGLADVMPYRIWPEGFSQDSAVLARFPLRRTMDACDPLVAEPCVLLSLPDGPPVEVRAVHPTPPADAPHTRSTQRSLAALPTADRRGPVRILAGDFNATLDHAAVRRLLATGYRDAAASAGIGLRPTWPYGGLALPPVTIDHILTDPRVAVREASVHPVVGSDHRAVFAELQLPRRR
jgi:endonuclease/exonuclease/phosphatase (EEP) superfamily protein YafD